MLAGSLLASVSGERLKEVEVAGQFSASVDLNCQRAIDVNTLQILYASILHNLTDVRRVRNRPKAHPPSLRNTLLWPNKKRKKEDKGIIVPDWLTKLGPGTLVTLSPQGGGGTSQEQPRPTAVSSLGDCYNREQQANATINDLCAARDPTAGSSSFNLHREDARPRKGVRTSV